MPDQYSGHKTLPNGSRVAMTPDEAKRLWEGIQNAARREAELMPETASVIAMMQSTCSRLRKLGWSEGMYCPKDGREFAVISAGCAAILTGRYTGTWPHGRIQVLDTGLPHTECWWKALDAMTPEETEAMERGMEFNRKSIEGHTERCAAMAAAEEATNDDA